MTSPVFFDTNILIYAALQPDPRSEVARDLLAQRGVISVQVLNEFASVAHRKLHRPWAEIARALAAIRVFCPSPRPITVDTHEAALEAGCMTLFSEDLQDGQVIAGRLTIRNPFGQLGR